MIRAGVFIGVNNTGNLEKLKDAAQGARRMYEWALSQGIDRTNAKLITDENGDSVSIELILSAIESILDGAGVDQLIIYFAGHGIYHNYSEQWLLSKAPVRAGEAVNVYGSVELARYCGVKHVVFISDACRVAASGIQALNVHGTEIFPNDPYTQGNVDQFFACSRGKVAIEYKDDSDAASKYRALYTTSLLEALNGDQPDAIDLNQTNPGPWYYVTPTKLDSYLKSDLPRRVRSLNIQNEVSQDPSAIVVVGGSWISRIDPRQIDPSILNPDSRPLEKGFSNDDIGLNILIDVAYADTEVPPNILFNDLQLFWTYGESYYVSRTLAILDKPFGPDRYESQCGFKVRGARIAEFFPLDLSAELIGDAGDQLRIRTDKVVNVLLQFEGNFGTVVPAIPGYIAALSFDEGDLISIAYEPSDNTSPWNAPNFNVDGTRSLRAVAASFSRYSRFSLEGALQMERIVNVDEKFNPSISVYAAYAYYEMQQIDRIRKVAAYQAKHTGSIFFDVALLSRLLLNKYVDPAASPIIAEDGLIYPFIPLLTQGWALLNANRVKLHPALVDLENNLRDSFWSLYDSDGLEKIKQAMQHPLS